MAQVWPVALQTLLNEANFGIKKGTSIVETDMDVGPKKRRRRNTREIDTFTGSIDLTIPQYTLFENFYRTTLSAGVLPFTYNHPITQTPTNFVFVDTPQYASLGGGYFRVSFTWEQYFGTV